MAVERDTKNFEGRNIDGAEREERNDKGRLNTVRPKSEKYSSESARKPPISSVNLIKKNLDDYISSLSNVELKQKLESCPGKLGECPLLNGFREGLKKTISNHLSLTPKNDSRLCKTSRNHNGPTVSIKTSNSNLDNVTMSQETSIKKECCEKAGKPACSIPSKSAIRSTRAQDLRSQSNRDLLRPKTVAEKPTTTSPYLTALPIKKKKSSLTGNPHINSTSRSTPSNPVEDNKKHNKTNDKTVRSAKGKPKKEKAQAGVENNAMLQRQKTQEIINPKIVKKATSNLLGGKVAAGDSDLPQLKKSQTFFICKGARNGDRDDKSDGWKEPEKSFVKPPAEAASDEPSDEDFHSPKVKPLTHNDSFCLITKSSQRWSQKNRSDDEKWLQYDLAYVEKSKKADKGILKNGNHNLKSVDSLEKVDSEKIVRFSDETTRNKKVLKKVVRRRRRLQNLLTPTWYQKNKLFQKYLQILREKSILLSEGVDIADDLRPYRLPIKLKERYEAEMFGLLNPKRGKSIRNLAKDSYSY